MRKVPASFVSKTRCTTERESSKNEATEGSDGSAVVGSMGADSQVQEQRRGYAKDCKIEEGGRGEVKGRKSGRSREQKTKKEKERSASIQEEWAPVHEKREPIGALMQPKVGRRGGRASRADYNTAKTYWADDVRAQSKKKVKDSRLDLAGQRRSQVG